MKLEWEYVKKISLWHYDPLIEKLQEVLDFGFVQEQYRHTMEEAADFALRLQLGYVQHGQPADFLYEIANHFKALGSLGVRDYRDLVERVDTQSKCETFIQEPGFNFRDLIDILSYLLRWALPFRCPLKELVDDGNETELSALRAFKARKIKSNLELLEAGRTRDGRQMLAQHTGIPEALLLKLVHRADMTRLAYVRGKTVRHLCGGGYDSLDKLAGADLKQMEADMSAYYQTLGKTLSDFKAVIPLDWMVGGARVLPRVMEGREGDHV